MKDLKYYLVPALFFCFMAAHAIGQQASAPAANTCPDVLIFSNGEKLIGHLQSAIDSTVTFKSEMAGVVTVEWGKVGKLQTSDAFAVIPKGVKMRRSEDTAGVPKGTLKVADKQVEISSAQTAPQKVAVASVRNVVNATAFENAYRRSGLLHGIFGICQRGLNVSRVSPLWIDYWRTGQLLEQSSARLQEELL